MDEIWVSSVIFEASVLGLLTHIFDTLFTVYPHDIQLFIHKLVHVVGLPVFVFHVKHIMLFEVDRLWFQSRICFT